MNGAAGDDYTLPTSARILARIWLALAGLVLAVSGAAALAMRIELWSPGMEAPPERYERLFELHAGTMVLGALAPALFAGLGNLIVPEATRAPPTRFVWLSALAILPWLGGVVIFTPLRIYGPPSPDYVPLALALFAVSLALVAIHYGVVAASAARQRSRIGTIVVVVIAAMLVWQIGGLTVTALDVSPNTGVDAALSGRPIVLAAIAVAAYCATRRPRSIAFPTPLLYFMAGVMPLAWLFAGASFFLFTLSVDVMLHDTYFVVGELHLGGGVVVTTLLAGVDAYSEPLFGRVPRQRLARMGCVYVSVGMIATSIAMLVLGSHGMPRRYADYLPEFELYHRAVTIGAILTVIGVILALLSVIAGTRASARAAHLVRG